MEKKLGQSKDCPFFDFAGMICSPVDMKDCYILKNQNYRQVVACPVEAGSLGHSSLLDVTVPTDTILRSKRSDYLTGEVGGFNADLIWMSLV